MNLPPNWRKKHNRTMNEKTYTDTDSGESEPATAENRPATELANAARAAFSAAPGSGTSPTVMVGRPSGVADATGTAGGLQADADLLSEVLPLVVGLYDGTKQEAVRSRAIRLGLSIDTAEMHAGRVAMKVPVREFAEKALAQLARKWGVQTQMGPEIGLACVLLVDVLALRTELAAVALEAEANELKP